MPRRRVVLIERLSLRFCDKKNCFFENYADNFDNKEQKYLLLL